MPGAIVGQEAVAILPDDRALDVFRKVTCAAERLLDRTLPPLSSTDPPSPCRRSTSSRPRSAAGNPRMGLIDWTRDAAAVHNLVRAVAPPYPGAFTTLRGRRVFIHRTVLDGDGPSPRDPLHLHGDGGRCFAVCGDGRTVRLVEAASRDGSPFDLTALARDIEGTPAASDPFLTR